MPGLMGGRGGEGLGETVLMGERSPPFELDHHPLPQEGREAWNVVQTNERAVRTPTATAFLLESRSVTCPIEKKF